MGGTVPSSSMEPRIQMGLFNRQLKRAQRLEDYQSKPRERNDSLHRLAGELRVEKMRCPPFIDHGLRVRLANLSQAGGGVVSPLDVNTVLRLEICPALKVGEVYGGVDGPGILGSSRMKSEFY